jgi:hypothetical protein
VKHQLVKIEFGAADSATQVSSANPFPTVQTGALPAGANAIGKLAANSGVDIGDVDVTSSSPDRAPTRRSSRRSARRVQRARTSCRCRASRA